MHATEKCTSEVMLACVDEARTAAANERMQGQLGNFENIVSIQHWFGQFLTEIVTTIVVSSFEMVICMSQLSFMMVISNSINLISLQFYS
jgi:hypothetical protein